jgi:putative transposase
MAIAKASTPSSRDELLDGEIFYSLKEAQTVIEAWRRHHNIVRPHSALGYRPPAPEVVPWPPAPASLPGAPGGHISHGADAQIN